MTDYLRICGPLHHMTGYGHMARAALRAALLAGYKVQAVESDKRLEYTLYADGRMERKEVPPKVRIPIPDCQWNELDEALAAEIPNDAPTLFVQLAPMFTSWPEYVAGPRIGWSMSESDTLHDRWARSCKGVDTLWVPSRYCADAFCKALPGQDLRIMPIPSDERIWQPEGTLGFAIPQCPEFLFVSVFATSERKQWRLLMQAFAEEFAGEGEKVGLLVKPGFWPVVEEMAEWCREMNAWVNVWREPMTDHDLATLYRNADCFVLPSSEGFGLCFIEAALCGTPSVALDDGAQAEFVTRENGYLCETTREQLIGHLPQIYPSTHRFPRTWIEELRYQLRRAYEDGDRTQKAQKAQERAQQYTCEALAGRFREEIERAAEYRRFHMASWTPEFLNHETSWCLAVGAWGDAFTSIGRAKEFKVDCRGVRLGFLHYGSDKAIAAFAAEQGIFDDVRHIKPASKEEYNRIAGQAIFQRDQFRDEWLPEILKDTGIGPAQVIGTHVNQVEDIPVARWHDAKLPADIRAWAHTQHRCWGDYILLHPISVQSAPLNEHWPGWEEALQWLIDETPYTYVLTGMECVPVRSRGRLINLIGQTPSMMHVLALAEKANGVIATCNAMSLWCVMQRIPALICSNRVFDVEANYFHRWVNTEPLTLLYHWDTVQWFTVVAKEWLTQRFTGEKPPEKTLRYEDVAPGDKSVAEYGSLSAYCKAVEQSKGRTA